MMPSSIKADVMLVGVTLLAAVSWIMSREAVLLMPPLLFMSLRFLLAALLLAILGHRQLKGLNIHGLRRSMTVGVVFAAGMSCWVMGIFTGTHVGEGAFLTSLGVVLVPVMSFLFFKEKQTRSTWLALLVACIGLALLSLKHGFNVELGQLFYLSAAIIFALFFRLNTQAANAYQWVDAQGQTRHAKGISAIALTAIVLAMVGVCTGLLSLLFEPWAATFKHFSLAMLGWIVASALVGTAMRFLLQTYAQSLSNNTHGVVIMVVEPVWVALLAMLWFGEQMSLQQLLGCTVILCALLISKASVLHHWLKGS